MYINVLYARHMEVRHLPRLIPHTLGLLGLFRLLGFLGLLGLLGLLWLLGLLGY